MRARLAQRVLAACLLLAVAFPAAAASRVLFYQPQRADLSVPESDWPALFAKVRTLGFDTLAVQWVAYGDAFVAGRERDWLERRLREAHAARLRLVLGLAADPAFFQRQKEAPEALRGYLDELARADLAAARAWQARLGPARIAAWYLPIEIDDLRWRDPDARRILVEHLRRETRALKAIQPAPVYMSSFFAGHMAPQAYHRMLAQVRGSGVSVWVQDGAGTARLTHAERALYLDALERCDAPVVHGIVFEIFRQVADDRNFAAQPMPDAQMRDALARRAPCDGDSVYFEMRYLPGMQSIREADRTAAGYLPSTHGGWAGGGPR